MMPISSPFRTTATTVCAAASRSSILPWRPAIETPASRNSRGLPTMHCVAGDGAAHALAGEALETFDLIERQASLARGGHNGLRQRVLRELFEACGKTQEPRLRRSARFVAMTCVTLGRPSVSVPVLSNITTSIFSPRSRASPFLIRMPRRAPRPVPTMMAVGVASPSEQGQAMTSTATAGMMLCWRSPVARVPARGRQQRRPRARSARKSRKSCRPASGSAPCCPAHPPPA